MHTITNGIAHNRVSGKGSTGTASTAMPVPTSEIASGMTDLGYQIETAIGLLSSVHIAFNAVLSPACPTDEALQQGVCEPITPLGIDMRIHVARLRQVNASLRDLLSRVQL